MSQHEQSHERGAGHSLIIEMSVRLLIPFTQLFGLYVIAHGHYSPGGGFQGGVILGASLIMMALAFDLKTTTRYLSEGANLVLANTGALIFVGIGTLTTGLGGMFLDYSALARIYPMAEADWRSLGILLVEVGVGLAVMTIMASLFWDISSDGRLDEGL